MLFRSRMLSDRYEVRAICDQVAHRAQQVATEFGATAVDGFRMLVTREDVDVVLVDADEGWDGLLPWTPTERPAPLVALLASEAPGRIAWALDQGADALIAKPVTASAVYPALVMATRRHAEARRINERIARLEERVRLRPLVHAAVRTLMIAEGCDENEAYGRLRREAMQTRQTLEQAAAFILTNSKRQAG